MSAYKSDFLNVLAERGFIHQVSEPEALDALACSSTITAYIGFDCTAASLHVGSLLPIMLLHWLQQTGHRPIALMGGGTTRVGDPSGKDESRRLLTDEIIGENLKGIRAVFDKFLKFEGAGGNAIMANNADWLNALNYIDFLRDVGRHFSINRMLAFDSVKLRLDRQQELSFLEFNYMILQAYDFVELNRRHGCVLQMGGSDQWGNIVSGIDLGRRLQNAQLFALTSPLITMSSGAKMGKTAAGAVWLNADLMSPYAYWQYWRNTEDADVVRFLKLFTVLPVDEIDAPGGAQGRGNQRSKESARHRGDGARAWPRCGRQSRRNGAHYFRGRSHGRRSTDGRTCRAASSPTASACSPQFVKAGLAVLQRRCPARDRRTTRIMFNDFTASPATRLAIGRGRRHGGRCRQALARAKAARPAQAGLGCILVNRTERAEVRQRPPYPTSRHSRARSECLSKCRKTKVFLRSAGPARVAPLSPVTDQRVVIGRGTAGACRMGWLAHCTAWDHMSARHIPMNHRRLGQSNGHGNRKQRYRESLQHVQPPFET